MTTGYWIYDIETAKNFFSVSFLDLKANEHFAFVVHPERDDREDLERFVKQLRGLVGFNSISYDAPQLRYFMQGMEDASFAPSWASTEDVTTAMFKMSGRLINTDWNDDQIRQLRYPYQSAWTELDLMKLMAFDKLGISLKQCAINLRWPRIIDLPFAYDAEIATADIPMVLDYNLNDVQITQALFDRLQPEIALRKDIKKIYKVDVTSASDSKIANVILESMLCPDRESKAALKDKRTKRESVKIADCIPADIKFQAPELCKLLAELKSKVVYRAYEYQYKFSLAFAGKSYQLGIGGLHSEDDAADFKSSANYHLRDADVSSYYPAIMLKQDIRPEHLGEDFTNVLSKMTHDRLQAKREGNTIKAATLKITINSVFGKLNSETFWLEDAKAFLSVTIAGQLYLLMLIEALVQFGIEVISANTDGVTCKIPTDKLESYEKLCSFWKGYTGFDLEFTEYQRLVRRDVNNYIAIKLDGKSKEKGIFAAVIDLRKGMKMPILQKCLYEYFVHGQPVSKTIADDRDIYDYAISQKTGAQFVLEYRTVMAEGIKLQKNNRFCISRQGGALVKRNVFNQKEVRLYAGQSVCMLNDIHAEDDFDHYNVNAQFYENEVNKIIQIIEPKTMQIRLF